MKHAMVGKLKNPAEGFADVINAHFYIKKPNILKVLPFKIHYYYFTTYVHVRLEYYVDLCQICKLHIHKAMHLGLLLMMT